MSDLRKKGVLNMNVEDAIGLMAKNPAMDFPWESALTELVNSFLDEETRLDPQNVSAETLREVIDRFDASTKEMIYNTRLTQVNAPSGASTRNISTINLGPRRHFVIFTLFGLTMCICAILLALEVGDGAQAEQVVELVKLIGTLMSSVITAQ